MKPRKPIADRFWPKVDKRGPDECWPWKGADVGNGYGVMGSGGHTGTILAHRVSWKIHFGEIPEGLCVCHKCDNRACCNPAHFFLGTYADNLKDMRDKGRGTHGEVHPNSKMTQARVDFVRSEYAKGTISMDQLAKANGVSQTLISHIIHNKIWKQKQHA